MFIIEEGDCIFVHDKSGRLVYKSISVVQYKKFSEESLVVITDESIDFINEMKIDGRHDITVVNDTNFIAAMIHNDLVLIQRKIVVPIIDIYNSDFINVVRLYQSIRGKWIYFFMKFGIPVRAIEPTYLKGCVLYGTRKDKTYLCNLEKREMKAVKPPKYKGISLQQCLQQLSVGVAK